MSAPKRIQRRRTRGWRMPEGAVYVGRPTRWGNPFVVERTKGGHVVLLRGVIREAPTFQFRWTKSRVAAAGEAVYLFSTALGKTIRAGEIDPADLRSALRGKDLACWCPLHQPCHADVLLEIANREATS